MDNKLTDSFLETMVSDNSINLLVDYSELAIDTVVENRLVNELPVVKSIIGVYKASVSIKERFLIKKMLIFIQEFNRNNISNLEIEKYRTKLEKNPKKAYKELEYIIILLERQTEYLKSAVLANLYFSFINEKIDWNKFGVFSNILEDLSIYDMEYFREFYSHKAYSLFKDMDKIDDLAVTRLSRNALVNFIDPTHGVSVPLLEDGSEGDVNILKLTETGELFYNEGMAKVSLKQFDFFKSY